MRGRKTDAELPHPLPADGWQGVGYDGDLAPGREGAGGGGRCGVFVGRVVR
jgi:hypothetical protein